MMCGGGCQMSCGGGGGCGGGCGGGGGGCGGGGGMCGGGCGGGGGGMCGGGGGGCGKRRKRSLVGESGERHHRCTRAPLGRRADSHRGQHTVSAACMDENNRKGELPSPLCLIDAVANLARTFAEHRRRRRKLQVCNPRRAAQKRHRKILRRLHSPRAQTAAAVYYQRLCLLLDWRRPNLVLGDRSTSLKLRLVSISLCAANRRSVSRALDVLSSHKKVYIRDKQFSPSARARVANKTQSAGAQLTLIIELSLSLERNCVHLLAKAPLQ